MAKPRITIVGLGRIGGSIGLALKKAKADLEIVGHDKDARVAQLALRRGAVDKTEWNLLNACDSAGLIVLAVPLAAIGETMQVLARELAEGVIVTDTASTKAPVLDWAKAFPQGVSFIGGDPIIPPKIAGAEAAHGIENAEAELFQNAAYCLVPAVTAAPGAVNTMAGFVSLLGARPLFLDAKEHDGLITGAEHLAYVLSAALLEATTSSGGWRDLAQLASASYLQATAPAARNQATQRDILLNHRQDLDRWIEASIRSLQMLQAAIAKGNAKELDEVFSRMIAAREAWLAGKVGAPIAGEKAAPPNALQVLIGGLGPRGVRKN